MSGSNRLLQSSSNVLKPSTGGGRLACRLASPAAAVGSTSSPKPTSSPSTKPLTTLQEANPRNLPEVWFNNTPPRRNNNAFFFQSSQPSPGKGPDDNKVRLGKSELSLSPPPELPSPTTVQVPANKSPARSQPSEPCRPACQPFSTRRYRRRSSRRPYRCTSSRRRTRTCPPCAAASRTRPRCGPRR